jgi:lysophospholipase L1-like esterase
MSSPRSRLPDAAKNVLLAMLAVLVLGGAGYSIKGSGAVSQADRAAGARENERVAAAADLAARQHRVRVVFLGDSYTGGSAMGGNGPHGYPALLSKPLGWDYMLQAVGGSGFLSMGQGQAFGVRVENVLSSHPDVIVVQGGHNDDQFSSTATLKASRAVLARLRQGAPAAKIVVLGPIWPSSTVPATERAIDVGLKQQAGDFGAVFVDPIVDGWFDGAYQRFIGTDGTHPTDAGHERIAELLLPVFRSLHLPAVVTDPKP